MSTRAFMLLSFLTLMVLVGSSADRLYEFAVRNASVAAAYTNDSEIIEITDPGPDELPPENVVSSGDDSVSPGDDSGSNGNQDSVDNTTTSDDLIITLDDDSSSTNTDTPPTINTVQVSTGSSGSNSSTGDSSSTDTSTEVVNSEEVITALIGNQAIVTSSGGGSSGGGGGGGIFTLKIFADRVRQALNAQDISSLSIPNADAILSSSRNSGKSLTRNDFVLFVSSAILKDENIQDITYTTGTLVTEYRALGRLFGVIPTWYRLRVSIEISESEVRAISVRFPWYKFFLSTGVSRSALESDLSLKLRSSIREQGGEFDVATQAFTALAGALRLRVGT